MRASIHTQNADQITKRTWLTITVLKRIGTSKANVMEESTWRWWRAARSFLGGLGPWGRRILPPCRMKRRVNSTTTSSKLGAAKQGNMANQNLHGQAVLLGPKETLPEMQNTKAARWCLWRWNMMEANGGGIGNPIFWHGSQVTAICGACWNWLPLLCNLPTYACLSTQILLANCVSIDKKQTKPTQLGLT